MNWPMVRMGDVVKIRTGKLDVNVENPEGQYPFFTCAKEPHFIDFYDYDCECVLIAGNGDLNVKYHNGKFNAYQRTYIVESCDKELISVRYLYYFFEKYLQILREGAIGGVIKYIKLAHLSDIDLLIPPMDVQMKVVEFLDSSSSLCEQSYRMENELNALAQAVFLEMFGDPISNPLAWSKVTLDEIAEVQGGLQVTGKRSSLPVKVDYLRVANVYKNELRLDEIKTIQVTQSELDRTCLKIGDMLVVEGHGNKDEIGRTAVWDGSIEYCTHQNHLIRVRFDESVAVPEFVSRFLNSDGGRYQINKICNTTSGLNTISANSVRSLKIPLPPIHLQRKFISFLNALKLQESKNLEIQEYIKNIFEALMQRSFSGKLNLKKVA